MIVRWIDSYEAGNDRILQFMTHNGVSICISFKNLGKENTGELPVL